MRTQVEIDTILRDIQNRLDAKRRATGVSLHVPQDGYVQNDDWLNVIVAPSASGIRAHEYVDVLVDVERELHDNGLDKVMLVPAIAD